MINDKTFTEWFDEQPDYGICSPPMNAQMAMDYLFDYLDIPPIVISQSNEQCNTEVVFEILMRYSKKFRKEYRQYRKKKRSKRNENT